MVNQVVIALLQFDLIFEDVIRWVPRLWLTRFVHFYFVEERLKKHFYLLKSNFLVRLQSLSLTFLKKSYKKRWEYLQQILGGQNKASSFDHSHGAR